jgi:GNAT superfamily N-acetyltransferase
LGPPIVGLCHIPLVFVVTRHWGRGIGRQLVESVLRQAAERGFARAQLWTQLDNQRARRLYTGLGFKESGRTKVERGEAILHFERPLP